MTAGLAPTHHRTSVDVGPLGIDTPGTAGRGSWIVVGSLALVTLCVDVYCVGFGAVPLTEITGITWAFVTGSFVAKAGTWLLLTRHVLAFPSRSLAVLASAYLLTSVLNLPFQLSFPGGPNGETVLGGPQTSLWMYFAWNSSFSILVAISALLSGRQGEQRSSVVRWMLSWFAGVTVLAALVGIVAITRSDWLPIVVRRGGPGPALSSTWFYAACLVTLACSLIALVTTLVPAIRGSRLRLWLALAVLLNGSGTFVLLFSENRWTVGWYGSRLLGLASSIVILMVLISEIISESGKLARTLSERDELAAVLQAAADGIVLVDSQGKIRWANQRAESILRRDQLVGLDVEAFVPAVSVPAVRRSLQRFVGSSPPHEESAELELVRGDNEHFVADIAVRAAETRSGRMVAVAIRDATDRLDSENKLAVARGRLAEATEQAPIGHAVVSLDGTYTDVNAAYCDITGYSRHQLLGRTFQSITHPDDLAAELTARSAVAIGESDGFSMEKRYIRSDGSIVWVEQHIAGIHDRTGRLISLNAQVIDVSARKLAERQAAEALADLSYRSTHDPLTGLLNHRELLAGLANTLNDPSCEGVAVLFCDIDRFKDINDGLGHTAGDEVLVDIGSRFRSRVRSGDLAGRVGGDEFVVVLRGVLDTESAAKAARDIRVAISDAPFMVAGRPLQLTLSVGVAVAASGDDADGLIAKADEALYRAKLNGRNRFELYDESMELAAANRLRMADAIRGGLTRNDFHAWFQPIVDLSSREVQGYEALARWVTADGTVVPAAEFISVAEETGTVQHIGLRVLMESIAFLATLPEPMTMAINASPAQLASGQFVPALLTALNDAQVAPSRLIVEVTEHAILRLNPPERRQLEQLWTRGVRLDIDDFGTGYSALAHIRDLPVTGLKLDKSFTRDLTTADSAAFRLAQGVALLAASLRLTDVAEGIETEDQARLLMHAGWTRGQGYLFGRPVPPPAGVLAGIRAPESPLASGPAPARAGGRSRRRTD